MLDANSQYGARRSKEEKEDTTLRLRVSAVFFFTQSRKGRMLLVVHSGINLRGKGSLRSEYRTEDGKDEGIDRIFMLRAEC